MLKLIIALLLLYPGNPEPEPITIDRTHHFGCYELGDPHKINGYYYEDRFYTELCRKPLELYNWIPGIPTYETQFLIAPEVFTGSAWAYSPDAMEYTAHYHALSLDGYVDGVAIPFCSEIGNDVWLKRLDEDWEGPFLVVDCAGLWDLYEVTYWRNESVEVGWRTAIRWKMAQYYQDKGGWYWDHRRVDNVMVSKVEPKDLEFTIYNTAEDLSEWFKDRADFYETQEEWEDAYHPISKTIDGEKYWKFSKETDYERIGQ